jgi:hypothetical protein
MVPLSFKRFNKGAAPHDLRLNTLPLVVHIKCPLGTEWTGLSVPSSMHMSIVQTGTFTLYCFSKDVQEPKNAPFYHLPGQTDYIHPIFLF